MTEQIFGIDLGTTYSCVSGFDENGKNIVFTNQFGDATTPSVLVFKKGSVAIGNDAKNEAAISPKNTIMCVKRSIGTDRTFQPGTRDVFRSETVSAFILKKLVKDVKDEHGVDVRRAVITCPAYFGINEREATKRAGELAGLDVVSIINEPSAAAFYYGIDKNAPGQEKNVLVYDLGGGTFDVTVIRITDTEVEVLSTGGDAHLGGVDWDEAIAQHFIDKLASQYRLDAEDIKADPEFMMDLLQKAEVAKRMLTQSEKTSSSFSYHDNRCTVQLSRDEFEAITGSMIDQTIALCDNVVSESGIAKSSISEVLLVGGSSRMPQVSRAVEGWFGRAPKLCNPDEAVARGAALYEQQTAIKEIVEQDTGLSLFDEDGDTLTLSGVAGTLSSSAKNDILTLTGTTIEKKKLLMITNVCSKSFGEECIDNADPEKKRKIVINIIKKNSKLPITKEDTFNTIVDNQTSVRFFPVENESMNHQVDPEDCVVLGEFNLTGLPPGRPKGRPLKAQFTLNEQGLLKVLYTDVETGLKINGELQTTHVISDDEMRVARKQLSSYVVE